MQRRICVLGLIVANICLCFLILESLTAQPSFALVKKVEEAPGQILYKSQQSLRDVKGNSWQVVLFRQVNSHHPDVINLRLVGFPGLTEFAHPKPLEILTNQGKILTASDVFAHQSPAPNMGQFDLSQILSQLPDDPFLKLSLPLAQDQKLILGIPHSWVIEWQTVAIAQ